MAPTKLAVAAMAIPAVMGAALPKALRDTSGIQIVGGVEAVPGDFPFIVSLSENNSHFCGGTLINANTVVTAGHCSEGQSASSVKVRAGSQSWSSGGTQVGVSKITIHPDFVYSTLDSDVAVWTLSEDIPEGDGISYATLTSQGEDPAAGEDLTVAGWGTTREGSSSIPDQLRKVTVPVTSRADCSQEYSGVGDITDNMFCAGLEEGGKDACQGDSGGPIVDNSGTLVGVVSWGQGCAQAGYSGVYTRLGNFIDWVNSV